MRQRFFRQRFFALSLCAVVSLMLILLPSGCGLKPKPIYRFYPKTRENGSESKKLSNDIAKNDSSFLQTDAVGDTGIHAKEASYEAQSLSKSYALNTTSLEWQLANELIPFLDTPYKYGGESIDGIDCSGLTRVIYLAAFDIELPHKASYQFDIGKAVRKNRLMAGDLVFFNDKQFRGIGHVGLYLSDNRFIHSMAGKGVVISNLENGYWQSHYAGARRYF